MSGGSSSVAPSSQLDIITAILAKVEDIECRLQNLPAMREQLRDLPKMREQLRDLPTMRAQLASLEQSVQRSLNAIEARTEELAVSVHRVDVRQANLDARVCVLEATREF